MLDDFMIRAGLAGAGLVLATGPLGCFVVWRGMAFFGDATAHAALLGVALALATGLPVALGVLVVALALAALAARMTGRGQAADSVLGVLSHSALALGLVAASLAPGGGRNLHAFLFGDILSVSRADLGWIWLGAGAVVALLAWRWSRLVTSSINEELAMAAGIDPARERLVLALALAVVVAVAIRIVGALLVSAMLIVPAAAARQISPTPERMAAAATLIGLAAVAGGLAASLWADSPAGPSIVAAAALAYAALAMLRRP